MNCKLRAPPEAHWVNKPTRARRRRPRQVDKSAIFRHQISTAGWLSLAASILIPTCGHGLAKVVGTPDGANLLRSHENSGFERAY
jgi:hypothetical protein